MNATTELVEVASEILSTVIATGVHWIRLSSHPRALILEKKGVFVEAADTVEVDDVSETLSTEDLTRIHVDVRKVLAGVFAAFGLSIAEDKQSFLRITGPDLPASCAVFFSLDNDVPPYAIRALDDASLCVVVHVTNLQANYNDFAHALGVHVTHLKDIADLTATNLEPMAASLSSLRAAAHASGADPIPETVGALIETSASTDPSRIEEYASTQQDRLFEAATALILDDLFDGVVVLGGKMRGRPVPDGLVLQGHRTRNNREVALYDCKSKKEDSYGLDPADVDQQARYLRILDRLKADGWLAPGIVMFTPSVAPGTFDDKCNKDYCRAISDAGYQLRVVQSKLLKRWWQLCRSESTGLSLHFDRAQFWKALMSLKLPGLAEADLSGYFGDRGRTLRLVTSDEAELCWLAGIASPSAGIRDVAESIRQADVDHISAARITRPSIVRRFHAELRENFPTLASIAAATSMANMSVRYLLANESFHPQRVPEMGERGASNLDRLRVEVGLSRLAPS